MPYDGAGNFTRVHDWTADKLAGIKIESERMDAEFNNFATGMNQVVLRNGAIPWTGDLKMGGNKIIGLSDGTALLPAISFLSDTTTGIFLQSAGNLGLSASGVERLRVNANGATVFGAITSSASVVAAAAGISRVYYLRTGVLDRWTMHADANAEAGANAGSDFNIARYADNGTYLSTPLLINRETGSINFAHDVAVGNNFSVAGAMVGQFTFNNSVIFNSSTPVLNSPVGVDHGIEWQSGGSRRWIILKTSDAETGGNAGSDFAINRYVGNTYLGTPLIICRATGNAVFQNSLSSGAFTSSGGVTATSFATPNFFSTYSDGSVNNIYFDNRAPQAYMQYNLSTRVLDIGINGDSPFSLNQSQLTLRGTLVTTQVGANILTIASTGSYAALSVNSPASTPSYVMHYSGAGELGRTLFSGQWYYVQDGGGTKVLLGLNTANGGLQVPGVYNAVSAVAPNMYVSPDGSIYRSNATLQPNLGFTPVQQGGGAGQGNNKVYIGWDNSSALKAQVDGVDLGALATTGRTNTFAVQQNFVLPVHLTGGYPLNWCSVANGAPRFGMFLAPGDGVNSTGSNFYMRKYDDAGNPGDIIYVDRQSGFIRFPTSANSVTVSPANMFMDTPAGQIYRSSSSRRFKTNIQDYVPTGFDMLRPVTYTSALDESDPNIYAGLIAEEVHDAGLTEFVAYDEEGQPEGLHYGHMVALLIAEVQALKARIIALEGGTPQPRTVPPTRPNPPPRPPRPSISDFGPPPVPSDDIELPEFKPYVAEPAYEPEPPTPREPMPEPPALASPPPAEPIPEPTQFPAPDDVPIPDPETDDEEPA